MAVIAHHHDGDGGLDPPPNPTKIPSHCESGIIIYNFYYLSFYVLWIFIYVMFVIAAHPPQKWPRATQKESRSVELKKLIHNNDGRPIDMIFDKEGGTWGAIGHHHGKFNDLIG